MSAIYKRELRSYFSGISGYVFIAFVLFFVGVLSVYLNFNDSASASSNTAFSALLPSVLLILAIAVPVLTMRLVADEKAQKTDKLLYSLPIKMYKVILGKYFAALTVFAVPCAVMCLYPLMLSAFGTVRYGNEYSSLLAFFLTGAVFIAIGLFISCLTDNPINAAFISIAALLVLCLMPRISSFFPASALVSLFAFAALAALAAIIVYLLTKNKLVSLFAFALMVIAILMVYLIDQSIFVNGFAKFLGMLSVYQRFTYFIYGVFDLRTLFYFISLIFLFLFFGTQVLEKKRWN